jgi:hypothetical protein
MALTALMYVSLVPFEEDPKDSTVWFLDHDYLEAMFLMYKKVNGRLLAAVLQRLHVECV